MSKELEVLCKELKITNNDFKTISNSILKGGTGAEIMFFLKSAKALKLNPLARQITAIKVWDKDNNCNILQPFPTIDGLRVIAERSNKYEGQTEPKYADEDGNYSDVWNLKKGYPMVCKVGVYKKGNRDAVYGIAYWDAYKRTSKKTGKLISQWESNPLGMLAKCAEALALRKAFPNDLSGIYTDDEGYIFNTEQEMRDLNADDQTEKYQLLKETSQMAKDAGLDVAIIKELMQTLFNKQSSDELTLDETRILVNEVMDKLQPPAPSEDSEVIEATEIPNHAPQN